MAKLKPELREILDKYGIAYNDKDKLWNCHGTLVLYHKAYEIIAAQESIVFDSPQIIEASRKDKTAVILVTGRMGDMTEWSFGEAAPSNSKNSYPFAMAEKRAKDRVIGKLVGLSQYVYSEDEAEDFKQSKDSEIENDQENNKPKDKPELTEKEKEDAASAYAASAKTTVNSFTRLDDLRGWMGENAKKVEKLEKYQNLYSDFHTAYTNKLSELSQKPLAAE